MGKMPEAQNFLIPPRISNILYKESYLTYQISKKVFKISNKLDKQTSNILYKISYINLIKIYKTYEIL